ncbi:MAG: GTP 3',8-cyclase MoaA [Chloroflexi bacterium]|nr:GTP 3',8-cyclase MoaA [Chloroflexota bacterium]
MRRPAEENDRGLSKVNDSYGRSIHYLRVSLTDRCNYRCVYCMPTDMVFQSQSHLLSDEEIVRLVGVAATVGFDRVRLTGGEPTVRPHLVEIVSGIARVPGIREIAMTTNAVRLEKMAAPLARAGLNRVNVSIDTLDAERFHRITRFGKIEQVWRGILAAESAGLSPIKLNSVILRGYNEQDLVDLAGLTLEHDWDMRFIEVMPLGSVADFQLDSVVPVAEMRLRIESAFGPLVPVDWDGHNPARPYRLPGGRGRIGFISSVTEPFCAGCDRMRLSADGHLRLCLLRDDEIDLMAPLRAGASDDQLRALFTQGIINKPWGHGLADHVIAESRVMSQIGG